MFDILHSENTEGETENNVLYWQGKCFSPIGNGQQVPLF